MSNNPSTEDVHFELVDRSSQIEIMKNIEVKDSMRQALVNLEDSIINKSYSADH